MLNRSPFPHKMQPPRKERGLVLIISLIILVALTLAGISLILLIIGHAYMGFWVKGSIGGMVTGYVSRAWARSHHERWYRQIASKPTRDGGSK